MSSISPMSADRRRAGRGCTTPGAVLRPGGALYWNDLIGIARNAGFAVWSKTAGSP